MKTDTKKRAVICTDQPEQWIPQLADYSIMIVNPASTPARKQYLLDRADWSLLIDEHGQHVRNGSDYSNERSCGIQVAQLETANSVASHNRRLIF